MGFYQSAKSYEAFIEGLPAGVYRSTIEGRFVFCNRALARIFGFESSRELMERPVVDLYADKRDRGRFLHEVLTRGRVFEEPLLLRGRDGIAFWCSVSARAVQDDEGNVTLLDGTLRDISLDVSEERFKGVLEMAGGVAHRLNQPLTTMNHLIEQILSDLRSADRHYKKVVRMQRLVGELNAIAKKIGRIRRYESMDYVAGVRIVDLDRAS